MCIRDRYKYIALKVAEIKRRNQEKRINSPFAYLRRLMQKDMEAKAEKETAQQLAVARGTQAPVSYTHLIQSPQAIIGHTSIPI